MSSPKFSPGDVVIIQESFWPPTGNDRRVIKRTAVYSEPGYPRIAAGLADVHDGHGSQRTVELLNQKLVNVLNVGDTCIILAVIKSEIDQKWYYLLSNGKSSLGWTRSSFRMKKLDDEDVSVKL